MSIEVASFPAGIPYQTEEERSTKPDEEIASGRARAIELDPGEHVITFTDPSMPRVLIIVSPQRDGIVRIQPPDSQTSMLVKGKPSKTSYIFYALPEDTRRIIFSRKAANRRDGTVYGLVRYVT
jgi:hypothetical protein